MKGKQTVYSLAAGLLMVIGLSGCGSSSNDTQLATGTTLNGTALKGPVRGATVKAFGILGDGTLGAQIGSATTGMGGTFTMSLDDYTGPVMLQMSDGNYTDEATGLTMSMEVGDVMTAIMPSADIPGNIKITPLTSMAQTMAQNRAGGMTVVNINAANDEVSGYFMVGNILTTPPMNPLVSESWAEASQEMQNYGISLAAMSQFATDQGMSSSSAIVTAMMNDASDGFLDGMMGNSEVRMNVGGGRAMPGTAGTSGLANAMNNFIQSTENQSGVTISAMQNLMTNLSTSTGKLSDGVAMTPAGGMISGTAFNGEIQGATVAAFAIMNGTIGSQLASGVTATNGDFTLALGAYNGPLMLQMNGGTYTDLATGTSMTMPAGTVMTAVMPSFARDDAATGINITPLTSMAQAQAQNMIGGMTTANITAATTAVGNYFMVDDILTTSPMDPLISEDRIGTTQDSLNYGFALAAMSQYAHNLGMENPSEVITAMMNDASDGILNGMMGSVAIMMGDSAGGMNGGGRIGMQAYAGTSGLAIAMTEFMESAENMSGLNVLDMQTLINQFYTSNGTIQ